ncbi:FG-GAP-like repeat-containing protein [Singulisphaera sp. Ch08]|uniref:FG-GAP-like repeat-containing protein n=1 Tax=Singulisphaera sp. Ch08 TaxID=3120278 RepID=A0AAU7CJB1_9BACT
MSRSAQQRRLTLEFLEDRTVLSFLPVVTSPVGAQPRAVTVADFNNDGKPDLAVVNMGQSSTFQSSLSVLLGNGNGSFQPAVTTNVLNSALGQGVASSVAVGDFNGDHLLDVALNTSGSPANPAVEVMLGKGDGSFQPNHQILSVGQIPLSVAVGDFDRNGALDLVTANSQGTLSLLLGKGDGTFRPRVDLTVGAVPRAVAVGDFNGDGLLDVATAQQLSNTVSVLLGHGDGTFARPQSFVASGQDLTFTPSSLAVGDANGDGRSDLVINLIGGEDSVVSQLGVLLGNGDGTFRAPILQSPSTGGGGDVALGDFNHDGRLDAAVGGEAALPDGLSVFNGNGDGTFGAPFQSPLRFSTGGNDPFGVSAADLNGDGLVDLVAANTSSNTVGVLLNTSSPVIAAATTTTLDTSTATAVFGQIELLTATVSSQAGTPIGFVTFRDGNTVLGFEPVDATGKATVPVSLGIGTHALTATFSGANGFAASDSAATAVTVNPAATTVALRSSVNPAVTGQTVTFTATVAAVAPGGGTPTGTVTFKDGNVVVGTVAVGTGGTATFTTSFAAAGGHVITAVYSGNPIFVASSQALTEQVNAPTTHKATTTALLASANPVVVGQAVKFTATVRDPSGTGTPTGTVTFFVGTKVVARVTLDANGQASFTRVFSRTGRFTIRAVYSGNATFDPSEKSLTEQVNS